MLADSKGYWGRDKQTKLFLSQKKKEPERLFVDMMIENLPNFRKYIKLQIQLQNRK